MVRHYDQVDWQRVAVYLGMIMFCLAFWAAVGAVVLALLHR